MVMRNVRAGLVKMKITVMAAALLVALSQTAFGASCDDDGDCGDGQFCTGVERCVNLQCAAIDYFIDYPCLKTGDDQDCDESSDTCRPAILTVEDGSGSPGASARPVEVSLENLFIGVKGFEFNICDEGDYLSCSGCQPTSRAAGFTCLASEENGCCSLVLYSLGGSVIESGSDPILTVDFSVSASAPQNSCRSLGAENVEMGNEYNVGLEANVVAGEFCFSDTPITSTTSSVTSTTTSVQPSYAVTVTPMSVTVSSGATLRFSAKTTLGGEAVAGTYTWQISPASTIGSRIDGTGLFTAGATITDRVETVVVTDTANGNVQATATVTVKRSEEPLKCEVLVTPLAATVAPGETLILMASSAGECEEPQYEWSLASATDSSLEPENATCTYTAGMPGGGETLLDTITVTDTVNDVVADAEITISPGGVSLRIVGESTLWKSPLVPLPYLLVLQGNGTNFTWFKTRLSFNPNRAIVSLFLFPLVFPDDQYIWDLILVLPSIVAGAGDQPVTVVVTTDNETVTGTLLLKEFRLIPADSINQ
jgi:hypothetical protein